MQVSSGEPCTLRRLAHKHYPAVTSLILLGMHQQGSAYRLLTVHKTDPGPCSS